MSGCFGEHTHTVCALLLSIDSVSLKNSVLFYKLALDTNMFLGEYTRRRLQRKN